ncbi:MAG: YegS/Rv2252/BmrU family lipid kinase [Oscillospiraceae bacterium]|nr:YegS/Rv2252/BmrU family lipid kinase [Oscillospiraceae bacterium]
MFHIVVNPAGSSGNAWAQLKEIEPVFEGTPYKVYRSFGKRSIEYICRKLTSQGRLTRLVVIGGDGTFNEAINGIQDFENTEFGFIPCGTGNDTVRDMNIVSDRKILAKLILKGKVRRKSDVGELTADINGQTVKRRFNISSDMGFGAATCEYVSRSKIKPILNLIGLGKLTYLIEAIKVCFTSKEPKIRITANGKTTVYKRCLCAIAMNHCYEGGGFKFCPNASFTDGKLDICIGDSMSHLEFLRMLPYAYLGKHLKLRGVYSERTDHILIESDTPQWIHTDGEVIGQTCRAEMRIIPEKLKLLI